jgi:TonB family protein
MVGVDGSVQSAVLVSRPQPIFDEAVLRAARAFRFEPAQYGGRPVPVQISFTHTFVPPPPPASARAAGIPLASILRGRLVEMGTRAAVAGATVAARVGGRDHSAEADLSGRFRLPLPSGGARVSVHAPGYRAFLQQEQLASGQELAVTYYLERERYDPYEIVVIGTRRREEVSRIVLRDAEIKQVPGTFGDPFRVTQTLPGVASIMSLFPFPVVRGTTPSSTGFLLDGTRVPLLYHLLAGPSVIHPEFIDEVLFFPGGAPALYGGYTGGIVDGRTRRARPDERLIDIDVSLMEAGALVRIPIRKIGVTITAAGRYGYPGGIMSLATDELSLAYWDYQLRVDGGNARKGWTFFAFGAGDELKTLERVVDEGGESSHKELRPTLALSFHRLDLRGQYGRGRFDSSYRLVLGYDHTESVQSLDDLGSRVTTWVIEPAAHFTFRPIERLSLAGGVESSIHLFSENPGEPVYGRVSLRSVIGELQRLYQASSFVEALWRPSPRWLIRPGLRVDVLNDEHDTETAVDPRLTVRFRLARRNLPDVPADSDASGVWLKGAIGLYHQPPRFVLPLPGLDIMPLRYGMVRSLQTSLGVEVPIWSQISLSVEGYVSYLNPTIFDLAINSQSSGDDDIDDDDILAQLFKRRVGLAYGLELMIRRQSRSGLYGWLAYTLSRSQRERESEWASGNEWVPYDFDRTHLVSLVAGLALPRNWDIGLRLQYQSARPVTTSAGYNAGRRGGYMRIDLRVDKRAVWKSWLLDFYVDIINLALLPEEVVPGTSIRYAIPTLGIRGRI